MNSDRLEEIRKFGAEAGRSTWFHMIELWLKALGSKGPMIIDFKQMTPREAVAWYEALMNES